MIRLIKDLLEQYDGLVQECAKWKRIAQNLSEEADYWRKEYEDLAATLDD